jgi:hypothetical protein
MIPPVFVNKYQLFHNNRHQWGGDPGELAAALGHIAKARGTTGIATNSFTCSDTQWVRCLKRGEFGLGANSGLRKKLRVSPGTHKHHQATLARIIEPVDQQEIATYMALKTFEQDAMYL